MNGRRRNEVMLRLTDAELELLERRLPAGSEKAVFARETLLRALRRRPGLREAVAAIVWALADDVTPEDAMQVLHTFRRNRREAKGVTK